MKQILVPTDFSSNAINAGLYALELAKEFNAKITLLNVYNIPSPLPPLPIEIIITPDELKSDTDSQLKKEKEFLLNKINYAIDIECISRNGASSKEINQAAIFVDADLIVMGMRGGSKIQKALFGTVTTAVINAAEKPTLIIPDNVPFKAPKNILIATDGTKMKDSISIQLLKEMIQHFNAEVHFVNVNPSHEIYDKDQISDNVTAPFVGISYKIHFLEHDDANAAINQFIETHKIDLLVMFPQHHSLISRLFSQHHTEHLANRINIPLLTIQL